MASENVEEYLECVFDLTQNGFPAKTSDIATCLKVSPASVTEMVQRLSDLGFLEYEKYKGATLTEKGMEVAVRIKRKHRLLESFLVRILGMRRGESHEEACRLEHTLSDESERRICQMMNNPQVCPDGKPIPQCDRECKLCESEPSMPLSELENGEVGVITHLRCEESPAKIRRLISMGFVPGRRILVEEEVPVGGPFIIKLDECRIAIGKEYASIVHVKRCN
ncbi:MAG: metal-dependent transcriptional regulator [Euryarchaeota archaeon]|nr:metal-dependent transcriptional regulator [Euryarchaeota archaeon]